MPALMALAACSSGADPTSTPPAEGAISGTLSVGPLCPVEPCSNPINPYPGLQVAIVRNDEVVALLDVNEDGAFSGPVPAGEYQLNVQPCEFLGCRFSLPVPITVIEGQTATVDIDIDTGIR